MTYQEMIDTVAGLAAADNIPRGEVLDADTITLITQLGASLSQRAVELAEENRALVANRDLLRREINERNQLITGLRAQIAGSAGSAELVGQAWSALGEAGIGQGPDLTLADAIRTLADTPLDALPTPDVTDPDHLTVDRPRDHRRRRHVDGRPNEENLMGMPRALTREQVREVLSLLGFEAKNVERVEMTGRKVIVTVFSHDENGDLYVGHDGEIGRVVYNLPIVD